MILGHSVLSRQALNRTLLHRQHLLTRSPSPRLDGFDPAPVSDALAESGIVGRSLRQRQ